MWLLAQPVRLHLPMDRRTTHVPDLLSVNANGSVTLWDARPGERVDDRFEAVSAGTAAACAEVGWNYEVFRGAQSRILRLNLRWLHEDRRLRPWHRVKRDQLRSLLDRCGVPGTATVGTVIEAEDPELVSAMWHYIWAGEIVCDLELHLRAETALTWVGCDEL
ncbi:hypothetical protein [Nocardioides nematodiphilus]|uniref:hypothetical protein n=1 Tax=Nocardioides nematodiphilus TaxID=2849669 RepID=UPI001CD9E056|nr:hypothetical protein [Nocardioides nematodiphilus]MCA1984815.1 hypothetical protein [Nocardioides nematodiphilus]